MMESTYVHQLYTSVQILKLVYKVYNRIRMGAFSVDSNLPFTCSGFFNINYSLHNRCTFNRKMRVGKGDVKILTLVTLKWLKEYIYYNRMVFV